MLEIGEVLHAVLRDADGGSESAGAWWKGGLKKTKTGRMRNYCLIMKVLDGGQRAVQGINDSTVA
jgi:hypothetical protein